MTGSGRDRPELRTEGYYLHVGPSLLPRQPRRAPMTLTEALHRAYGLRFAVVFRLREDGRPVPVVADAGSSDEVIHLPSGRRMVREGVTWHAELSEAELAGWRPEPGLVEFTLGDDPWWTPERRVRLTVAVLAAGFRVRVR
jgi:hypothetical protein